MRRVWPRGRVRGQESWQREQQAKGSKVRTGPGAGGTGSRPVCLTTVRMGRMGGGLGRQGSHSGPRGTGRPHPTLSAMEPWLLDLGGDEVHFGGKEHSWTCGEEGAVDRAGVVRLVQGPGFRLG